MSVQCPNPDCLSEDAYFNGVCYECPDCETKWHANGSELLAYIIHSGFISGYQNRYGDNLKPPTNVYHRMTA